MSGTNDQVMLSGGAASLIFTGSSDKVFLGGGTTSVTDNSSGLQLAIGPAGGALTVTNLANDPTAVFDLIGGVGGFSNVSQVLSALASDGHGGTKLILGSVGSIDFANLLPSSLHNSNFLIKAS